MLGFATKTLAHKFSVLQANNTGGPLNQFAEFSKFNKVADQMGKKSGDIQSFHVNSLKMTRCAPHSVEDPQNDT